MNRQFLERLCLALMPGLILATVLGAAWPGYLSFDAAFQWSQARSGVFSDVAPPLLPALWSALLRIGFPDTSGPLLLTGALHAFAFARLALLAEAAKQRALAWSLAVLAPLCPFLLSLIPHVWTDVLLSGAVLAAAALLVSGPPLSWVRTFAFLGLLVLASGARHNGILAVLPLVLWWAWSSRPDSSRWRRALPAAALIAGLWGCKLLFAHLLVAERMDTWAVAPMIDLQAVSVAQNRQLLPASVVGPGMDVEQLRAAFHPYQSNLFAGTTSGVVNPTVSPLTEIQKRDLMQAWQSLTTTSEWWEHRWRMFRGLLGTHRRPEFDLLVDSPGVDQYADNPALERSFPSAHAGYRKVVALVRASGLFAPGFYLLLGVLGALVALLRRVRRRDGGHPWGILMTALFASAWAYTLPYFLLAPSAEIRYLLWPCVASWLVFVIGISGLSARRVGHTVIE